MRVTIKKAVNYGGDTYAEGEVAEVPDEIGQRWIRRLQAERADDDAEVTHELPAHAGTGTPGANASADNGDEGDEGGGTPQQRAASKRMDENTEAVTGEETPKRGRR